MIKVKVMVLNKDAKIPKYGSVNAAGVDFVSPVDKTIMNGETVCIGTGLGMAIPIGYEVQIRSRSGLSLKQQVVVMNSPGTIDADYRGEIGIILTNCGTKAYEVHKGDKIAQGVLSIVPQMEFNQVSELDKTERGAGGFGHTGK